MNGMKTVDATSQAQRKRTPAKNANERFSNE